MAEKKQLTRVELTHPSGEFTVSVDEHRAKILQTRGYKPTGEVERPKPRPSARRTTRKATPAK